MGFMGILGGIARGAKEVAATGVRSVVGSPKHWNSPGVKAWNTAKMMGLGAAVGGIGGFASSDSNSPTQRFYDTLGGAAVGAMAVGGVRAGIGAARLGARGIMARSKVRIPNKLDVTQFYKNAAGERKSLSYSVFSPGEKYRPMTGGEFAWNSAKGAAGSLYDTGKVAGKLGLGAVSFGLAYPGTIAVAGLGALGVMHAYGMVGERSPTLRGKQVNMAYDKQAIAAQEMNTGMAPMGSAGTYPQMQKPMQRALQQSTEGLVQGMHKSRHGA